MKEFLSVSGEQLFGLLPAVYRERDNAERDRYGDVVGLGDLASYLDACGHLLDRIRNTQDQRLADSFPDNPCEGAACQGWLVPYFARLLDVRLVSPDVEGQRDEVANAIIWRQQKGTLPCLKGICEVVLRNETEVQEGWRRVAVTPRVGTPLLPVSIYGVDRELDRNNPRELARHPGLPAVTVDLRCPSRAVRTGVSGPEVHASRFGGVPYSWLQANPQGAPVSPGSFDDVSRRTVDLRTPDWRQGHAHPKRVLVYSPPPQGLFPHQSRTFDWEGLLASPLVAVTRQYVEDKEAAEGRRLAHLHLRTRSPHPIVLSGDHDLPQAGPDADLYTLEGIRIPGRLQVESAAGRIRRLRMRGTLVGALIATAEAGMEGLYEPSKALVDTQDCLIGTLAVPTGPVRMAGCTVLRDARVEHLQARDSILAGLAGAVVDVGGYGNMDHCRVPQVLLDGATAGPLLQVDRQSCTAVEPIFFLSDYGDGDSDLLTPDAGVLAPTTPSAICLGARDGGEMGAYHGGRGIHPVVIDRNQTIALGQDDAYELRDLVFAGCLTVEASEWFPLRLRQVACAKLTVLSQAPAVTVDSPLSSGERARERGQIGPGRGRSHQGAAKGESRPIVLARDSLFDSLTVANGLARLEYCTVLGDTRFWRLQASDCLFNGLTGAGGEGAPTAEDCIRFSRIPVRVLQPREPGLVFPSCTSDEPVFFHTAFAKAVTNARPGCGVLHPAAPATLCFGAEDGGELGAHHAKRYCLRGQAVIDKALEHLPVGLDPVLVPDPRLNHPPLNFDSDEGAPGNRAS